MIFVIGATGKVGRHVVSGLLDTGAVVRALARDPDTAGLPQRVEVVRGDLSDLAGLEERLDGAEAVFLVWPFFSDEGAGDVVEAIARHTGRIVYLSAQAAEEQPDSFWAKVERFIEHSGVEWTFLRPTGFAANTRMWADQIRETGVVRWPYGHAARSLIDERDIAAVAVHALTEPEHTGARYVLTGPETLTQIEQVHAIGQAIGRPLRFEEVSPDQVRPTLVAALGDEAFADGALATWAGFVDRPERTTSTVQEVTGRPAHSLRQWADNHADWFR